MKTLHILFLLLILSVAAHSQTKVSVHLVNFADDQRQPYTKEFVESQMQIVSQFYADMGPVRFDVSVNDWRTLPINGNCDFESIQNAVNDPISEKVIIAFPEQPSCGYLSGFTAGNTVFINGNFYAAKLAHELGHTYGLAHSAIINSQDTYGDIYDVMGGTFHMSYFNAFQREKLGWLVVPQVETGTYSIPSYGAIKIRKSDGTFYNVEYRDPKGFDLWMLDDGVQNAVILRQTWDTSYLIGLVFGTYSDSEVSLTLQSVDDNGANVSVTTPTPTPTPIPCSKYNRRGRCVK